MQNDSLPYTVELAPNAHMHAHSGGTVKFAKAHCDSMYPPRKLILENLQNKTYKSCVLHTG